MEIHAQIDHTEERRSKYEALEDQLADQQAIDRSAERVSRNQELY